MATYVIGDVQGCMQALERLLAHINFNRARDQLWFCGDLVNRGPQSLAVLRFVRELGPRARTVLGNHDLHLLATATGDRKPHQKDTLDAVLAAPDCKELLAWLRRQPLLYHDSERNYLLVHAGLPPQWDLALALDCAAEVEAVLRSPDYPKFFAKMYGDRPDIWSKELKNWKRLRMITNALTRIRYCDHEGRMSHKEKGSPNSQTAGLLPWFLLPARKSSGLKILFGHWATLRLTPEISTREQVYHLDTGCVWGGRLTAFCLDNGRYYHVPCESCADINQVVETTSG